MKTGLRRILAFGVDWLVILAWGMLLFAIVMTFTSGEPVPPSSPWALQAIGFLSMTLPVILYFAICESSVLQGTFGKRIIGLKVSYGRNGRVPLVVALARNVVKFSPWELGHLVANQAAYSGSVGIPAWVYGAIAMAFMLPAWWVVSIFLYGMTPYDWLTSTKVLHR